MHKARISNTMYLQEIRGKIYGGSDVERLIYATVTKALKVAKIACRFRLLFFVTMIQSELIIE